MAAIVLEKTLVKEYFFLISVGSLKVLTHHLSYSF